METELNAFEFLFFITSLTVTDGPASGDTIVTITGDGFHSNVVGEWVDAMVRVTGPAVLALDGVFRLDWSVETRRECPMPPIAGDGSNGSNGSVVQVAPSGPGVRTQALHQLLLTAIFAARKTLVVTTPYFVPDESMVTALLSAALVPSGLRAQQGDVTQASTKSSFLQPCEDRGLPKGALCGKYEVFEDRATGTGRKIGLNIIVLKATGPNPVPDPVFYIAGNQGPTKKDMKSAVSVAAATRNVMYRKTLKPVTYSESGNSRW